LSVVGVQESPSSHEPCEPESIEARPGVDSAVLSHVLPGRLCITRPKPGEEFHTKTVEVSGEGAPAGSRICLVKWLVDKQECWLEESATVPERDGHWSHRRCRIPALNARREVFALAVRPRDLGKVRELLEPGVKDVTMLEQRLQDASLWYELSAPVQIIRTPGV